MASLHVVPATEAHILELAPRLRVEDVAEITAHSGRTPLEALLNANSVSVGTKTVLADGKPVAVWGVLPTELLSTVGSVWLLGAKELTENRRLFVRACRGELQKLFERWTLLFNFIDARYKGALSWARWLGFHVEPAIPFGPYGMPFHPIWISREDANV